MYLCIKIRYSRSGRDTQKSPRPFLVRLKLTNTELFQIQPWNYVPDLPKQDEQEELMEGKRSDRDAEEGVLKNGASDAEGALVT